MWSERDAPLINVGSPTNFLIGYNSFRYPEETTPCEDSITATKSHYQLAGRIYCRSTLRPVIYAAGEKRGKRKGGKKTVGEVKNEVKKRVSGRRKKRKILKKKGMG